MAVSQIEEKILGRLARETAASNQLLSAALYQVLGLSILLSPKLVKARRLRKLDTSRDTKSLQLYHHIIWLAREGLSITEVYILPYCQNGENGPQCRVMAAKLRASFYHIFCLFHNHPPISSISTRSGETRSSPSSGRSRRSPKNSKDSSGGRRKTSKSGLRDPIPSMTSDASYITNPYAGPAATPPPPGPPPPIPTEARRTPIRPPGLEPINITASQTAASFLLPPLNFVPMAREHFETAQHLANTLLPSTNALRLSLSLDHAVFLWECEKDHERARRLARRTIKEVYASTEGLDDEEFANASVLVQALGGIVRRSSGDSQHQPGREQLSSPQHRPPRPPLIDRAIAVSPPTGTGGRMKTRSPLQRVPALHTPERLSTVPEVESTESTSESQTLAALSPPVSRLSSRSRQWGASSSASEKAAKRRVVEQAEQELYRRGSASSKNSRQATPPEGIGTRETCVAPHTAIQHVDRRGSAAQERRLAVLRTLEIISSVSRGLHTSNVPHGNTASWRLW